MDRKSGWYAVIGGVVGAVLTMAVCSVMPIGAQNGDATFGKITCTELAVVDAVGRAQVVVRYDENGGRLTVVDKSYEGGTMIGVDQKGRGTISVSSAEIRVAAMMHVGDDGGHITVYGKGETGTRVAIGVNEYGNGGVSTWDKNGYRLATLK